MVHLDVNPLVPRAIYMAKRPIYRTFGQNFDFNNIMEGILKKIPLSVATMSRYTKRACLELCVTKNNEKKDPSTNGLHD